MSTPGYTDYRDINQNDGGVAGDFLERQKSRGFGIQNVASTIGNKNRRGIEQSVGYTGKNTDRTGKRLKEVALEKGTTGRREVATTAMSYAGRALNRTGRVMNASARGFAFRKSKVNPIGAKFQVGMAMGWTGLLNILSFVMGVITLVAFGATSTVASIPGGETVVDTIAWWFGYNDFDIWILAVACFAVHLFLVLTMYMGSYLQLKLGGLQPIHGKLSGMKSASLIGALVISLIPGANFVPWIWVWLFVVAIFPN